MITLPSVIIDIAPDNKEPEFLLPLFDYFVEMACKLESSENRLNCKNLSLIDEVSSNCTFYIFQSTVNKVNKILTKHISNK